MIQINHAFNHLLLLFTVLVFLIIFSFSVDYLCLSEIYINAFRGLDYSDSFVNRFFNLTYFSIVTFTSVGFGDIVPLVKAAKIITVFEMITAFAVIVFLISKYLKKPT